MLKRGELFAALRRRLFWIDAIAGTESGLREIGGRRRDRAAWLGLALRKGRWGGLPRLDQVIESCPDLISRLVLETRSLENLAVALSGGLATINGMGTVSRVHQRTRPASFLLCLFRLRGRVIA